MSDMHGITKKDVLEHLRVQTRRATLNRDNAIQRRDHKAEAHLNKKLAIFEFLKGLVENIP